MYSKLLKTYPSTLSYIRNYVCHKHTIHNILVLNVRTCIVYVYYILIFIFVSNKFISRSKIYLFLIVGDIGGSKQPAPREVLERKHSRVQSIIKHWLKWRISRLYNLLVDVAICWELLGSVGVCWGLLGSVGGGEKKQAVCWCACRRHPRKSKETYKFKGKKRLLWKGSESLLFMMVFEPRTMAYSMLGPKPYH